MGLDMYLYKKHYIGANFDFREVTGTIDISIGGEHVPVKFERVSEIIENVGYWRKANAIHKWFVDECQNGIDECQEAYVDHDKLKELLDICEQVKAVPDLAPSLLPVASGFFFGGMEYDEYYMENLDYTIKLLTSLIAEEDFEEASFYYQSSW